MKRIALLLGICIVLFSCEKDERSSQEWSQLVTEKMQEINQLITSVPCNDPDDWFHFTHDDPYSCAPRYFPMHPSIKDQFDRLWAAYQDLLGSYYLALTREGVIIDPCFDDNLWFHHEPIGLECRDNQATLIYIKDLDVEESRAQITEIYPRIAAYLSELTCEDSTEWTYAVIMSAEDCSYSFIPFQRTGERQTIQDDIALYNAHVANIIEKEKPDCSGRTNKFVEAVVCENGKPVVKTREY